MWMNKENKGGAKYYMKRLMRLFVSLCMLAFLAVPACTVYAAEREQTEELETVYSRREELGAAKVKNPTISVVAHQESFGNLPAVSNGVAAGRPGSGKRLEGVYIGCKIPKGLSGTVTYRSHVQSVGWQGWVTKGNLSGTLNEGKRLEAIQIQLTGTLAKKYNIYYRTYISGIGWMSWAKNGEVSGTTGYGATLEGIQVLLVKKGAKNTPKNTKYPSITTENTNDLYYRGHVQTYGDIAPVKNGATLGVLGQSKRMENITIAMTHNKGQFGGCIQYRAHVQNYGWMDMVTEGNTCGTSGQGLRMEAISIALTGDIAKYFNICYRVHIQTFGWLSWARNGENAGSQGYGKRIEGIEIRLVPKFDNTPMDTTVAYMYRKAAVDLDVPLFLQSPELPSGCESCALTMALNYWKFGLKKTDIADKWLTRGSDFMMTFNGSPYVEEGGCIYAPGLTNVANNFLIAKGSFRRAHNITGASLDTLKMYLSSGYPVMVYFTSDYGPSVFAGNTSVYNGKVYKMSVNLHCIVLSGFDDNNHTVKLTDSIWGLRRISQADFEKTFETMYRMAIVIY